MIFLLIVGGLFFIGAVSNLINGVYDEAMVGVAISILAIGIYSVLKIEERKNRKFIEWLYKNYNEVLKGNATYNGIKIMSDTELKRYQFCLSFLFISFKKKSKYYISDYHFTKCIGFAHSMLTCVLGWWGLPWGPIYTVQVILNNIKGGEKITVHELLSGLKRIETISN